MMRILTIIAFSCLVAACEQPPEPTATAADGEVTDRFDTALLRVALSVRDLDRSKHFYAHVLGMRPGFDGDISRPAVLEQLQLDEGQTVRFAILYSADRIDAQDIKGAMIGLMEVGNPAPQAMQRPPGATLATGEGVLAVVTSDIYLVEERLREFGAPILYGPKKSADGTEAEVVFYDPDGIRVHVVEVFDESD